LAVGWAKLTEPFGLRYGKSHLVTFGLLVAGLSIVFTEAVHAFEKHGKGLAWGLAWGFGLLASAAGFALSPSAAAREIFFAERPTRWFALMLAPLGPDADGDGFERPIGFSAGEDCDDHDPLRNPLEPEILGNGIDDNCFAGDQHRSFRELFAEPSLVGERERPTRNVLVLVLDSWRFDVRSPTGVSVEHSPKIADFARQSLVFTNYRTCAPRTLESFGDLFFGRLMPTFRGAPTTSAVAELTAAGVHTVDISSRFRHEHDRVSGWAKELSIPGRYGAFDDASTVAETKRVLRDGIPQPFFVATHLMGAHEPYEPRATCAARAEGYERYLCALTLLDERVADILRALSDAGLREDTVVVVTADHGEEFGEHGARYHANTVYDEVLRVPLLVRIPGGTGETVREPVGCFDFMPTLLGAANLPGDPLLIGHDFSRGPRPGDRAQFARTRPLEARGVFEPKTLSVVVRGTKLLVDRQSGLAQYFDLHTDPEERRPLAHVAPSEERALRENMDAWLSELARQSVPGERTASASH
jgi:arylsulfatase A-like enzyme